MYKLMIVEDELIIRQGLKKIIDWESLGFTIVQEASDGKTALKYLEESQPDVILTDVRMPIMDGLQLMSEVNSLYPKIKIVVLSGYGDFSYAQHAIKCGVLGYILKPTKDNEIYQVFKKVKDTLDEHESLGQSTFAAQKLEKMNNIEDPIIVRVKSYIDENFSQKITLETASKITYMNPSYFCTYFKQKTGISFKNYLIKVRMEKAQDLLLNTDFKTYHIASMVGYDDYHYFSKLFKSVIGKSTSQIRK